jgi:long-subunit fatty acid transport protein
MWNTVSFKHKFNKKFALLLTQEFRLKENYSQINVTYTELGLEYSYKKNIKTSLVYRNIQKFQYQGPLSFRNRLQWDIVLKKNFSSKIGFNYRHRLQAEVKDYFTSADGTLTEWFSRHKIGIKYDFNDKWNAAVSAEYRLQINDPRSPEYNMGFHRQRYQAGFTYKINNKQDVGIYYLYQNEFNIQDLTDIYILGIEYSFEF